MMGWYGNYGWNGWMVVMMLAWPVLIGLAIWAVVALTRRADEQVPAESPRQILDRRFAAGEIDIDAYTKSRSLLENHPMAGPATTGSQ